GELLFASLIVLAAGHLVYVIYKTVRRRLAESWQRSALRERALARKAQLTRRVLAMKARQSFGLEMMLYRLALPIVICLGAFLIRELAWRAGYSANALGLLGCHFWRTLLLLLAWHTVLAACKAVARKEMASAPTGLSPLDLASTLLIVPGCAGCYPVWPVVLLLLSLRMFLARILRRSGVASPGSLTEMTIPGVALTVLLFTVTWYLCASTTRQAFNGLSARIEAKGPDRLMAWATDVIAAHKQRVQALPVVGATVVGLTASPAGNAPLLVASAVITARAGEPGRLARDEIPDWVDDLLGPFQGIRSMGIENLERDPCVALYTGGSAYHFAVRVCPSRVRRGTPPWWAGEDGSDWWPGISLSTEGK
ncbi:MAG TPA: hypothetical protein VKI17_05805, partial [Gemmataceae bacterium]|nr:hypothetical protein [Gemmataceae bacterium]